MEKIHTITVTNRRKIKNIKAKFPHLMSSDYDLAIEREYSGLLALQDLLQEARDKVRQLEKDVKEAEEKWRAKQDLFDIEYETIEKEVKTEKSNLLLKGMVYSYEH